MPHLQRQSPDAVVAHTVPVRLDLPSSGVALALGHEQGYRHM